MRYQPCSGFDVRVDLGSPLRNCNATVFEIRSTVDCKVRCYRRITAMSGWILTVKEGRIIYQTWRANDYLVLLPINQYCGIDVDMICHSKIIQKAVKLFFGQ